MRNVFKKEKVVEEIKTRIFCPVTFFFENLSVYDNEEKFFGAGHATDDNLVHALFTLDT
jgi:hypothetical protein